MRVRKQLVVTALALPLLAGMTACGEIQEAQQGIRDVQQGLGAAQACVKALRVTSFMPNWDNPEQARADAAAKAEELGRLAQQTSDQTLKQNLLDVQGSLSRVASGEVTVQNSAAWAQRKLDKAAKVTATCSRIGGQS